MKADDWVALFCSEQDWAFKKPKLVSELNKQFGGGFASVSGDFISLRSKDGGSLHIRAVSPKEYRLGNHLDLGDDTGTPVAGEKLIYHIGSFAKGSAE